MVRNLITAKLEIVNNLKACMLHEQGLKPQFLLLFKILEIRTFTRIAFIFSDDFRLFCGDLGNEVTDETLGRAFSKYTTFVRAKVVRDKRTQKTKRLWFCQF